MHFVILPLISADNHYRKHIFLVTAKENIDMIWKKALPSSPNFSKQLLYNFGKGKGSRTGYQGIGLFYDIGVIIF